MAEKVLEKIGGTSGHGTFEIVDVDGVVEIRLNGTAIATVSQGAAVPNLTDSSGGTAGATITDVGAAFNQATLNNNFASLTDKVNDLLVALRAAGVIAT